MEGPGGEERTWVLLEAAEVVLMLGCNQIPVYCKFSEQPHSHRKIPIVVLRYITTIQACQPFSLLQHKFPAERRNYGSG